MPRSYFSIPERCKLIFTNLSPFPSQTPSSPCWKVVPHLPRWDAEGHPPQRSHLGPGSHAGCQGCGFQHNKNNIKTIDLFQDRSLMQGYPAKLFQAATVLADGRCLRVPGILYIPL